MEQRICHCGSVIESTGRGRPRKYCLRCLPRKRELSTRDRFSSCCEGCGTASLSRYCYACKWRMAPRKPCRYCGGPTGYRLSDGRADSPTCQNCRTARSRHGVRQPSVTEWTCEMCGAACMRVPTKGQRPRFCSKRCQQSAAWYRRRALEAEAFVEDVPRHRVFESDAYRCHLCGRMTDRTQSVPHPRAPTIDHLQPLSKGGKHERSNCRTACFACNCAKQDRGGGEQFALAI